MTPERARELIDVTIGGTVPDAEVGVDAATRAALDAALAADAELRRYRGELREDAASVAALFQAGAGDDEALAERVLAGLDARPRGRLVPFLRSAAAILLGVAVGATVVWRTTSGGEGDRELAGAVPSPDPRFVDVAAQAGIDRIGHAGGEGDKQWMVELVGHGAAALDFDGDDDLDLFVPDGSRAAGDPGGASTWRLYRNDGEMRFSDVTPGSGLEALDWGLGAVAADFDADGRPDLFVPCWGGNRLFLNSGGGRFRDATEASGVAGKEEEWSTAAAVGDVDADGDLDLYVSNYAAMSEHIERSGSGRNCKWRGMEVPCGPQPLRPQRDRLYLNRGDGTFADATTANIPPSARYSFQPVLMDLDDDGDLDIFVAADTHPNLLLVNDGTGRFRDAAHRAGVAADASGLEQACMGVAAGDVDADGLPDLLVTNFSHEANVLYLARPGSTDAPRFVDATGPAGLAELSRMSLGWGASLFDFDLDGRLDAMIANGHLYPGLEEAVPETSYRQPLSLLRGDGAGGFVEVAGQCGADLLQPRVHGGLLVADFDDDGLSDVFVTVLHGRAVLLRNVGRAAGNWVRLTLRRANGVEAPGARVTGRVPEAAGTRLVSRDVLTGSSFSCSEDPRLLFGLGSAERLEQVEVRWPGGARQAVADLEAGGWYEVVEGRDEVRRIR